MTELWSLFNVMKDEFEKEDGSDESKNKVISISKSNAIDLKKEKEARRRKRKQRLLGIKSEEESTIGDVNIDEENMRVSPMEVISYKTEWVEDDSKLKVDIDLDSLREKMPSCYYCKSKNLVEKNGEAICCDCGTQNGDIIDPKQEIRYCGNDDGRGNDPNRYGMPVNELLPNASLATVILGFGYEKYRTLHRWNSLNYKEKSLMDTFSDMSQRTAGTNISTAVVDKSQTLYKMVHDKTKKKSSKKNLAAACIYLIDKDKDGTAVPNEIALMFDIKKKKMSRGCKKAMEVLHQNNPDYFKKKKAPTYHSFIKKFCSLLGLGDDVVEYATHIAEVAYFLGINSSNTPPTLSAGAIYLTCQIKGLGITKPEIKKKVNISDVTINNSYKGFLPYLKVLLPIEDGEEDEDSSEGSIKDI